MPLPFLLIGAALLAGGYGAKKGVDAYDDSMDAKKSNEKAEDLIHEGESVLKEARNAASKATEELGATKFVIYEQSILPFVEAYNRIKNIDFDDNDRIKGDMPAMDHKTFDALYTSTMELSSLLKGGIGSLGSGALAGLATYGGVGWLGTASTGTAIGTLSGAAATNATLAWLGGGSLAAGGYGMAGGMVVLGGLVAGPVLAVGGMFAASKAKEALENAKANLSKAKLAKDQMLAASDLANGMARRYEEVNGVIQALDLRFSPMVAELTAIVESKKNYQSYTKAQKQAVYTTASLAKVLKVVLEAELIDENGSLTPDSRHAVEEGERALTEFDYDD